MLTRGKELGVAKAGVTSPSVGKNVRTWCVVAIALIVGCGDKQKPVATETQGSAAQPQPPEPPFVRGPSTVFPNAQPGAVVAIDEAGALAIGALDRKQPGLLPATRRPVADPQRLRREVLTAIVDNHGPHAPFAKIDLDDLEQRAPSTEPDAPSDRSPCARVVKLADVDPTSPLMFVDPHAPAKTFARALVDTGGALAAGGPGELALLDLGFDLTVDRRAVGDWVEVYLDVTGIRVLGVPNGNEIALAANASDAELAQALQNARGEEPSGVDVLVGLGPSSQALIDLLVRLDKLAIHNVAVGEARVTLDERREQVTRMRGRDPNAVIIGTAGFTFKPGLSKEAIKSRIKLETPKVVKCYEHALIAKPRLRGTLTVSFFVEPNGTVTDLTADGFEPAMTECVLAALSALRFPKRAGDRTRVNYPFSFRPAG